MNALLDLLHQDAERDRARRIGAAPAPAQPWRDIGSVLKDGTLLDVRFAIDGAEPGMAEFYAPGCTAGGVEPVIENVAFINGAFVSVIDLEGAQAVAAARGGFAPVTGVGAAVLSVTLDGWRPAAHPPAE